MTSPGEDRSTLRIDWLLPDGRGAGRTGAGRVLRVRGAVPGDEVVVQVRGTGRRTETELLEVVTPSADRRSAPCPHSARCGGCDLDVLAPEARRRALAHTVAHALRLDEPPHVEPSPRPTGHRARIKLAIEGGRVGYRAPRSHELVAIDRCAIARPEVQQTLDDLRGWLAADTSRGDALASVELRSDGARCVLAFASDGGVPATVRADLDELGDVAIDGRPVHGNPTLTLQVHGVSLRVSPRSFYQVNLEANERLVGWVRDQVLAHAPERVLDLYAGIGNLSLPLAARGIPVVAVESEGQAVRDLQHSARAWPHVRAVVQRAERFDPSTEPFDVALLDPPRAGAPGVLPRVVRNRPRLVVYVSCHAPSAARDLRELGEAGYRRAAVRCFDLFPDTHHVETVLVLERRR